MMAGLIRFAAGIQPRWIGLDPLHADGSAVQRIYFANHASHLDSPILWAALPASARRVTRPVAAKEYWETGIRRLMCEGFRPVFVERCGLAAQACAPMEAALAAGDSLILYPEGTRNLDPEQGIAPFKSGLYHLGKQFPEVELVPVVLGNVGRMMPKGVLAPIPLLARVTFGAAVPLLPNDDKTAFLTRAHAALQRLADGQEKQR